MKTINQHNKNGAIFVRKLRSDKLRNGLPFMIHVKELSSNQCYYEFPDGKIELVAIASSKEISTIKILSRAEANQLRERLHFEFIR